MFVYLVRFYRRLFKSNCSVTHSDMFLVLMQEASIVMNPLTSANNLQRIKIIQIQDMDLLLFSFSS